MDEIEVPQYFICPISLHIMKDPVTAITGITYDRDSIEHWLVTTRSTTCRVTKQPLPTDSDLTPNHTLRRLIQTWCTQHGADCIPTPKAPLDKLQVLDLLKQLHDLHAKLHTLTKLKLLAAQSDRNNKCLAEAGVPKAMINFIVSCHRKAQIHEGLEEALSVLQFIKLPDEEIKSLLAEDHDQVLDSLTWALSCPMENSIALKSHAAFVLKSIITKAPHSVVERLKFEFFEKIAKALRIGITQQGTNAALHVLLSACPWGRNRMMMVKAGVVFEVIEMEMGAPEKRTTELTLGILFHMCCCAEGRARFLSHRGSIAMLAERILKVSLAVDDRAVYILSLVSKLCGTQTVIEEMVKVGTVSKLCMLLQADHPRYLKDKAREILKSHSEVWKSAPCFPGQYSFYASKLP